MKDIFTGALSLIACAGFVYLCYQAGSTALDQHSEIAVQAEKIVSAIKKVRADTIRSDAERCKAPDISDADKRNLELTYAIGISLGALEGMYLQKPSVGLRAVIEDVKRIVDRRANGKR